MHFDKVRFLILLLNFIPKNHNSYSIIIGQCTNFMRKVQTTMSYTKPIAPVHHYGRVISKTPHSDSWYHLLITKYPNQDSAKLSRIFHTWISRERSIWRIRISSFFASKNVISVLAQYIRITHTNLCADEERHDKTLAKYEGDGEFHQVFFGRLVGPLFYVSIYISEHKTLCS